MYVTDVFVVSNIVVRFSVVSLIVVNSVVVFSKYDVVPPTALDTVESGNTREVELVWFFGQFR